jgi:hypothetical protein
MTNPPDDERELVERVARAIASVPWSVEGPIHEAEARAAIDVVLEEAAKVASAEWQADTDTDRFYHGWNQATVRIAMLIRALNPKER